MQKPSFSIIIPTHGRPDALNHCLEALARLDYPPEQVEIIIVYDGDGPDQPPGYPVKTLTQPKRGPAAARNLGAAHAAGTYLAFTDDDCLPSADWLGQLSAVLAQFPDRMVGGRVINALTNNSYAAASQLLVEFLYEQFDPDSLQAGFFASNNMAVRRDLFLELGGFDTTFPMAAGEDRELCRRWLNAGYGMIYQPEAIVHHTHALTLTGFWRQHLNYGRGAYHFRHTQARQQHRQLKLEPVSFYLNLLRYPFKQANGRSALRLFALFLIMQVANTLGFLRAAVGDWFNSQD
ncbi:MAG: glycosyltransferase [Candidatus Promineifilaceae bacterium]